MKRILTITLLLTLNSCVVITHQWKLKSFIENERNFKGLRLGGYYYCEELLDFPVSNNDVYLNPPDTVGGCALIRAISPIILFENGTSVSFASCGGFSSTEEGKEVYPNSYDAGHSDFQEYVTYLSPEKLGKQSYGDWGFFSIKNDSIELMHVSNYMNGTIIPFAAAAANLYQGIIMNDSTFILKQYCEKASLRKCKEINQTYHFRKFDSIPKNVKSWVSKRIE